MPPRSSLLARVASLALAFAGCGGGSPDEPVGGVVDGSRDPDGGEVSGGAGDAGWDLPGDRDAVGDGDGAVGSDLGDAADEGGAADVDDCEPLTASIERTPPGPGSGTDGPDPAEGAPVGQSVAGRVRDDGSGARLFEGGEAACRPGDFVLANEHVRACIAGERAVSEFLFDGGHVSDLENVNDPGDEELVFSVAGSGFLVAGSDGVALVSDGSDGGPGVVRTTGPDVLSHFLAGTVGDLVPSQLLDYETEYRLQPGARALEVVTWVRASDGDRRALSVGDLTAPADGALNWFGAAGFVAPGTPAPTGLFVTLTENRSYGIWGPGLYAAGVTLPVVEIPLSSAVFVRGLLCAGDEAAYRRWVAVGSGDTLSVREKLAAWMPARETVAVSFSTVESPLWPSPRFEIQDADGQSVDVIRLVGGSAEVALPVGSMRALPVDWPGVFPPAIPFTVPADETVELLSPTMAQLDVRVETGGLLGPVPSAAKVRISGHELEQRDLPFGEGRFYLPTGDYTVTATRGEEFSAASAAVTLDSLTEPATVTLRLERVLDTVGWVSGDLHLHSKPSLDSSVPLTERVASCVAAGLDFMGPSDHGAIGDFEGAIAELGVSDRVHLLLGEEVSPGRGHFSVFPRSYDAFAPAGGGLALGARGRGSRELFFPTMPEYVEEARRQGAELVQLNHPRGGLAMFTRAGYDPIAGPEAIDSPDWIDDFDSVEIYNTELRAGFCENLRDWFGLLSRGWRIAGVGNSDTHDLWSAAGFPRTYVASPTDDPSLLTSIGLIDAIRALRVTVSGGIFIDFPDGELPGDTVAVAPGETYPLRVRLQSPAWVGVDELRVYVDGAEVERLALMTEPELTVDFDDVLEISVDADAYVVLLAWSATRMTQLSEGRRPFGVTNPIYFDLGGDGWTPPGVAGPEDLPPITDIAICR